MCESFIHAEIFNLQQFHISILVKDNIVFIKAGISLEIL